MEKEKKILKPIFAFSQGNITGAAILDNRRSKSNGLYPIKYRVTYKRERVYYASGYDASEKEWEILPTSHKEELKERKKLIKAGFDHIETLTKNLIEKNGFSFDALNSRMGRGITDNVFVVFEAKIKSLMDTGQINTSDYYKYSKDSVLNFLNKSKKKNETPSLKFVDITVDWLNKYQKWLLVQKNNYTTISMRMRALRTIVNEGKEQGFISESQYPFGEKKYSIPTSTGRKLALTLGQIGEVMKYPLNSETELRCRDLWFFSYLCNGINIIDLLKLKFSDINNDEISFYRQKTLNRSKNKKKIEATLLPQMKEIIDKWGNKDRKPSIFIFPFLTDGLSPIDEQRIVKNVTRLINKKMNEIGTSLKIGNISTYAARHSFATVSKRSGVNVAYIAESLGHTDIKTTEHYLDSFEKEERFKNASFLTNF
jgi:integrase